MTSFAYRVFDSDNNGYITFDELKRAMQMIGESVTEKQLQDMLNLADVDKDGRINYEGKLTAGWHRCYRDLKYFESFQSLRGCYRNLFKVNIFLITRDTSAKFTIFIVDWVLIRHQRMKDEEAAVSRVKPSRRINLCT